MKAFFIFLPFIIFQNMFRENNSIYSERIGFKTNDSILIIIREKSDSLLNYVNSTSSLTKIKKIVIDAKK